MNGVPTDPKLTCDECSEENRPHTKFSCTFCGGNFRKCGCPFGEMHECRDPR